VNALQVRTPVNIILSNNAGNERLADTAFPLQREVDNPFDVLSSVSTSAAFSFVVLLTGIPFFVRSICFHRAAQAQNRTFSFLPFGLENRRAYRLSWVAPVFALLEFRFAKSCHRQLWWTQRTNPDQREVFLQLWAVSQSVSLRGAGG
jgi:hypothetical protein